MITPRALVAFLSLGSVSVAAAGVTIVPGSSCPWLAGMPTGTRTVSGDTAGAQSPAGVLDVVLTAGARMTFTVTGSVLNSGGSPTDPPDGQTRNVVSNSGGREFGLSNIIAPLNCLVGVFLDDTRPDTSPDGVTMDFSSATDREYVRIAPQLKQIFFIGDGKLISGALQETIVPVGATRLFLGSMDGFGWRDNVGQFEVGVIVVPGVGAAPIVGLMLAGGAVVRPRRRAC